MFRASKPALVLRPSLEPLISQFMSMFPEPPAGLMRRSVGREAEHPVVWPDGTAADVRLLLAEMTKQKGLIARHEDGFDRLLSASDTTQLVGARNTQGNTEYALEVGWGTIELSTGPESNLVDLKHRHEEGMVRVVDAADRLGMKVLGYGIQPRTPPSVQLMSPRGRYRAMHEALGPAWLSFSITCSDQLHVDIHKEELIQKLNASLLLTPLVIALCGNSPIFEGRESGVCSGREFLMRRCQHEYERHGMVSSPFADIEDWFERMCAMPFLMRPDPFTGVWHNMQQAQQGLSLSGHFARTQSVSWSDFLAHEHYIWNSVRPRVKQRTLELRSPCQQPWGEHAAASALQLGLVEGMPTICEQVLRKHFPGGGNSVDTNLAWRTMRLWHKHAVTRGLEPVPPTGMETKYSVESVCSTNDVAGAMQLVRHCSKTFLPKELVLLGSLIAQQRVGETMDLLDSKGFEPSVSLNVHVFVRDVLDACSEALEARGYNEQELLQPLYQRLERGKNPAQVALEVAAQGGLAALVSHAKISL